MAKSGDMEGWDFHLRSLSTNARDSSSASDPASDPYLLQSVRKIYEICKQSRSEDLIARAYPHMSKLFQRIAAALPQSQTSSGLLLLIILQFFLDFGEVVLHDADPSLRTFFRSCLSREFADPVVAEAALDFLNLNKAKLLSSFPTLLPQFFPLLLKLIAWNGEKLERAFTAVLPAMMAAGSFLPLFSSLVDVPTLLCALIPLLMSRNATLFPERKFSFEVRKRLLDFMLAAFQRSPDFIALLKTELALQLCWAIGEHGAGGISHKDVVRELFESLELLLYENLKSSCLGLNLEADVDSNTAVRKSSQARLLCFVLTAIAKLATCHNELLPIARVSLAKVASSRNSDKRVRRRACDYLGLINEPAICLSVLGPSTVSIQGSGSVNWSDGGSKMIAHIPFYILNEQEGPPFHDFSFADVLANE